MKFSLVKTLMCQIHISVEIQVLKMFSKCSMKPVNKLHNAFNAN